MSFRYVMVDEFQDISVGRSKPCRRFKIHQMTRKCFVLEMIGNQSLGLRDPISM